MSNLEAFVDVASNDLRVGPDDDSTCPQSSGLPEAQRMASYSAMLLVVLKSRRAVNWTSWPMRDMMKTNVPYCGMYSIFFHQASSLEASHLDDISLYPCHM